MMVVSTCFLLQKCIMKRLYFSTEVQKSVKKFMFFYFTIFPQENRENVSKIDEKRVHKRHLNIISVSYFGVTNWKSKTV